jgi:uncharacterized protein (UPF0371 family)
MAVEQETPVETVDASVREKDLRNGKIIIAAVTTLLGVATGVAIALVRKSTRVEETVVLVEESPVEDVA